MTLISKLLADFVREPVGVGVQRLGVPLVSGVPEHQALVTSSEVVLFLSGVDTVSDFDSLRLHIDNDIAVGAIETNIVGLVTNLLGNITSNLLEVNLVLGGSRLTEQNDLNQESEIPILNF